MLYGSVKFSSLIEIGFAHHFTADKYAFNYRTTKKSIEIVYVTRGGIVAELDGEKIIAPEGSIFVLFRNLPIKISSLEGFTHAHCTVQAELDYDLMLIKNMSEARSGRLLLPFVTPPSPETEEIKKELFSIVSDMTASREDNSLSCALRLCGILQRLDRIARRSNDGQSPQSPLIVYKIKKYIASRLADGFTMSDLSKALGFSESYLNHTFKEGVGMSVKQYASCERVKRIAELTGSGKADFETACANVGIRDVCYGYRLFKKHMGVTPLQYAKRSKKLEK